MILNRLNRHWNKKIIGLPSLFFILLRIAFKKLANQTQKVLFSNNISSCGKNLKLNYPIAYSYPQNIIIGDNVSIGNNTLLTVEESESKFLRIGNGVSIVSNCTIDFTGGIIMEDGAHIGSNVYISTHDHGYNYRAKPIPKPLIIKKNAFIGSNSIILHNVNVIGENSLIGNGSVVTKDVPANAIVAGNPARVIKYLSDQNFESKNITQ